LDALTIELEAEGCVFGFVRTIRGRITSWLLQVEDFCKAGGFVEERILVDGQQRNLAASGQEGSS
jgi:hypothetical protein